MANNSQAVAAALAVMDAHIKALNLHDAKALAATLHFPQHRLSGTSWRTWDTPQHYFDDFLARAGSAWKYSGFADIKVMDASEDKVHLDAEIRRYNANDELITTFRSLWVIIEIEGVWAAKVRSSFAPD